MLVFAALIVGLVVPQAFGYNELQNMRLVGHSMVIDLDIEFGQDDIRPLLTRSIITPQLEKLDFGYHTHFLDLSNSRVNVYGDGKYFSIANVEKGVLMYGFENKQNENYRINVYLNTNSGLEKHTVNVKQILPIIITEQQESEIKLENEDEIETEQSVKNEIRIPVQISEDIITIPPSPIIDSEINWDKYQKKIKLDATSVFDSFGEKPIKFSWIQTDQYGDELSIDHPDYTGIKQSSKPLSNINPPRESKTLFYELTTFGRGIPEVHYSYIEFIK